MALTERLRARVDGDGGGGGGSKSDSAYYRFADAAASPARTGSAASKATWRVFPTTSKPPTDRAPDALLQSREWQSQAPVNGAVNMCGERQTDAAAPCPPLRTQGARADSP